MEKTTNRMRRLSVIVLCISMFIGILPITTPRNLRNIKAAETNATADNIFSGLNDYSSEFDLLRANFYLNDEQYCLYDQLDQAANDVMEGKYTDFEGEICVPYFSVPGISKKEAEKVANTFLLENPLCFWIEYMTYGKTADGYSVSFKIRNEYKSYDDLSNKWNQMKVEIEKYLAKAEFAPDDYTKAFILYKELTSNNKYRYDANGEPSTDATASTIEGIFLENSGVCEAFASSYALLLSLAGVPNTKIRGWANNGTGHAWNVVEIQGELYLCDATWDVEKTDNFAWFMRGDSANDTHILKKVNVPVDIPERFNYSETDVGYYSLTIKDCNLQPKVGTLVTIPVMYDSTNEKVEVYNNGMLVSITDGSIAVVEGTILTVDGFCGDKMPVIGIMNGSVAEQYNNGFVAKSGQKIIVGFSNDVVESLSPAYKVKLERDGKTGTALVDVYLKSGRVLKERTVTLTRNEEAANAFMSSDAFKEIVHDDVWCDKAKFDYGLLAVDTLYDAEVDDLSSDITIADSDKKFQLTALQRGDDAHIVYSNGPGYELRVFDSDGNIVSSSGSVPVGEPLTIKLYDGYSEVPAKIYCSTGDESTPKLIDKDLFTPAGISYLTWEPEQTDNTLVSVEGLTEPYIVENGLAPEEIAAMILPAKTKVILKDGRVINADIEWNDFSSYDCKRKMAETVTVNGTVVLPNDVVNPDNVSTDISASLEVKEAIEVSFNDIFNKDEIPAEIYVPNGTPMVASEVGLTPVYLFYHEFQDSNSQYVRYLPLKLQWTYDDVSKKMIGTLDADGFVCNDAPIEVSIIEETGGITVPEETKYNINFTDANGTLIDGMYPKLVVNYKGMLSFSFPDVEQTEREIILTVPKGLTNVSVFNATLIEGVESADVNVNPDGTSTITVKIADDYDITKTMNIEFSYTPIYNSGNNDLVDYNNKNGRRFTDWADDFGMMYPIGDEIPFKLSYKANENGNIGSVNLPIANRPRMKASSSFVYFTPASNEVKQSPTQTTKIKGVKATSITDTSPYVISLIGVYPTPDISSSVKNIVNAYRYGTVYNNAGDFYYNCQFENGRPEGQYSGKVAYAVCKDVFGQVYTVVSESNTKITISRAADMLISADVEEPYAWANPKEDYMLMHAFPEGGVAIENAVELACAYYDKRSTTSASYLYGPITTTYEIPDGTRPVFVQTDDAKFTFVYTDGTKEIIPSDQMVYYYENYDYYASILEVDTALSRGEKRIKELIVEEFKNPWATMAESPMLALETCATYEDGTPVALGSYLCYIGDDVKTDCPKVTGNIIVDNATSLYTKPYDAYLIGYGVTNVSGANFSKLDDSSLKYSISKDQPKFQATFALSRTSLGDEDINNITLVCTVADSDLFSITGISKGVNFDRIKFYFSNGDVETYERYQVQSCRLNTDGRTVTKFEIECDSSDFMNQLSEIVYGQFSSKINFKRYKELYGVTDQNVKMLTGNIYVDGNKVFEMDDYYVDIKGVMDDRQAFSVKNPRYIGDKYVPKVLYNNNEQSISIESKLKQSDYAYVQWRLASYSNLSYVSHVGPHRLKSCTFTLRLDNGGELDTDRECYMEYAEYKYDDDGDGTKEKIIQEEGKCNPVKMKQTGKGTYEITFEDFYAGDGELIYIPIRGSMNTSRNITASLYVSDVAIYDEQDYVVSNETKNYADITYYGIKSETQMRASIVVLTAYTEKIEGYGISVCNTNPYEDVYKIADDETFTYSTHIFNTPNAQMNNIEFLIQVPKKGQKLVVPNEGGMQRGADSDTTYNQEFTAVLKSISVPTAADRNYKKYYTLDSTNWMPFDDVTDISDVSKVQAIKVTADHAVNTDEIVLTFDSADGSQGTSHLVTAFSYTDSNSGMNKSGYTRVVPFKITPKLKLRVLTDEIDFGEFSDNATMSELFKHIEIESLGCREVPGVKVSLIAKAEGDMPEAFMKDGDFVDGSTDTLNPIPADSTTYIAMHIAQNYPKGIYNAVMCIEWTDDDGKNSKHIPVHFSVVGQKTLRYHSNANDETVKGIPSQVSTYESNIQVSDNQPTREGYVFKGWSYSATDKRNLIEAGTAISLAGDVDLYAVWEAKTIVPDNPEGDDPKQPSEDPKNPAEDPKNPSEDPKNPAEDPKQPVVDPEQQKPTVEPAAPENEETKPAEIVEATTTEESTSPTKGPKTGDDTPIIWLFILSLLSATGFLVVKHRR